MVTRFIVVLASVVMFFYGQASAEPSGLSPEGFYSQYVVINVKKLSCWSQTLSEEAHRKCNIFYVRCIKSTIKKAC